MGATQDASKEGCASLEDEISAEGPPSADKVVGEAPSAETAVGPLLPTRRSNLVIFDLRRLRGPNKLVLNSCVKLMKWNHPSADTSIPSPDAAQSIIDRWNPFNQRDTFVTNMHELYPINLQIPVVAISEEYSIPFPDYMDGKSYPRVAKDGMYIRNHDFNETTELVWLDF